MKFRVTMKDPDTLHDSIKEAVEDECEQIAELSKDEKDDLADTRRESVAAICKAWFKWGEYLTVEIDTEAKTCVVVSP